jgi:SAM-dependent methyltransferase
MKAPDTDLSLLSFLSLASGEKHPRVVAVGSDLTGSISFDRAATIYDETRGGEQRGKLCAEALEPHFASSGLTLEIGVGTGLVGAALQAGGRWVVGVDISVQMLQRARDRNLAVARADGLALPFASGSVDDAYSVWVLHLVADPAAVLLEVMRVLRPGGRYVTELTSIYEREHDDIALILREMDRELRDGQPPRDDPKRIVPLAQEAGFHLVETVERSTDVFLASPNESAALIERREYSKLWDLDANRWQAIVEPALTTLRALPEPDRQRERRAVHEIIVFEKPH